jgi:ubiquinone/menaquinone biosynthesis C-methylase UbiE
MTSVAAEACPGLYGCGGLRDGEGAPLRPGGLALTEALVDLAGFHVGETVADVGCGLGASTRLMRRLGVAAIGVDLVDSVAGEDRDAPPFVVADGARLPFADASLDGVLCECSLSTMADRAQALVEWRRALRSGGRLALSDVYSRAADGPGAGRVATRAALLSAVAAAGFRVARFEDRSEVLKRWAAQFIFQYGSLEALWGGAGGCECAAARLAALGYFLMIAVKPGEPSAKGG